MTAPSPPPDYADVAERQRLEAQRAGDEDWRLWGPYLAERAWGTVREDYSADGEAWDYFSHDQSRSRAYRWNEDGLGGISDAKQYLCFALALWNGRDQILKERAFGLTGNQGNRGEDVKEVYYYRDATPTHSWLRYQYKYPQSAFPYARLVAENANRGRDVPAFELIDSGAFDAERYWDVEVRYAKATPQRIHCRITADNRGQDDAALYLLPTLWFRNTWGWGDADAQQPSLAAIDPPDGAGFAVRAEHPRLGTYFLYGAVACDLLFTENETNARLIWGSENTSPYVKDAFNRWLIDGDRAAVNPAQRGTKCAAVHQIELRGGEAAQMDLVLSAEPLTDPFAETERTLATRQSEATIFYDHLLPEAGANDARILRQALAGMIWTKQFYHYDVARWLDGDQIPPPAARRQGRNRHWRHLKARDIISMPDKWEYPWFAAWDLAYHCAALALVDVDFAKDQVELMVSDRYLHPNGQIPAYEWNFGDVNPPVHAMAALKVFRAERIQRGAGDHGFLQRVFHKLLLNFSWWINRKDADGHNLFEGGFLGLDNISVYDRSKELPPGWSLKQADATGWMAHFSLKMTLIALELCIVDSDYEEIAIHCYKQFLAIAEAIAGSEESGTPSLWDDQSGFFMDLLQTPDQGLHRIEVYSWVGLIPLFAVEIVNSRMLEAAPRFRALLDGLKGGFFRGNPVCACPEHENARGERLLALVDHSMLARILSRVMDEAQFLSRYGVRSLSRIHDKDRNLGYIPGIGEALIEYVPGESTSPMFGGNSNWRGPVWLPTNYSLLSSLERFHRFLGDEFRIPVPSLGGEKRNLKEIATLIAERIADLYRVDEAGSVPALRAHIPSSPDPTWRDQLRFYEYFHAETGQGLGAAHQTGWSGLLANLVMRRYQKDIQGWSGIDRGTKAGLIDEIA
ncbi:glucosidase [uncultured Thiohalocapsa sp.]|uniref:MGH1-like glycoside hydrolase domain-containing protein n=1 Tax=uncultured Thiohalocapsa sp. TaxID=768990 RepID=UPI0025EF9494|nr:glucosidase [uncultured Thiohalocapsa sp.]